jgi:GNAT superfamily N-acetyltransferase
MNTSISIKEVSSKADLIKFISFPKTLYKDNNYYIPTLKTGELKTLSPDKNPAFEFCKAKYWLAMEDGQVVGRVAGIINKRYNASHQKKYVRFGWLDFIQEENVVKLLMQTVEDWARQENMEYIHGPLGFTSFDASGILIKGFDEMPTAFAHYNYVYYAELLEKAGYKKDIDWVEYQVKVPQSVPEKVIQVAELIKKRYGLRSAVLKKSRDMLKYSEGIFQLLNSEYRSIYAFSELSEKQVQVLAKDFVTILEPAYISIILDSNDTVIAFGITMPSLAKALRNAKGRLWLFVLFKVFKIYNDTTTVDALLIAVKKEYQSKGITGLIFNDIIPRLIEKGFVNFESTKEMEGNVKVNNLWHTYEHRQHKRTRCYIKKL